MDYDTGLPVLEWSVSKRTEQYRSSFHFYEGGGCSRGHAFRVPSARLNCRREATHISKWMIGLYEVRSGGMCGG